MIHLKRAKTFLKKAPTRNFAFQSPPNNNYQRNTQTRKVHLLALFTSNTAIGIRDLAKALFLATSCFHLEMIMYWVRGVNDNTDSL